MRKNNFILLMFSIVCFAGVARAQEHCFTDEVRKRMIALHPEFLQMEAEFEKQIEDGIRKIDLSKVSKTTFTDQSGNDSFWYDLPVVVHIVHDYNNAVEYMTDDLIFNAVKEWNITFAKQNADTADVVAPFKGNIPNSHTRYIGNAHIRLHLASNDPHGNPTKGITRRRSYLTYSGNELSKFDDWSPTSYINIWFINKMSGANGQAAAYAHMPSDVYFIPFWDGVISLASYITNDNTINHEIAHCLNLSHTWGRTNDPAVGCGDDNVDDTPPTMGHATPGCQYSLPSTNPNSTYDSLCATNYYKIYTDATGHDSLVNYPDTSNAQNVMDYTYCSKMFTTGQVRRMHTCLNSSVAGRNNLWDTANLIATGVWDASFNLIPRHDLKPIPEFSATRSSANYMDRVNYFTFPNTNIIFRNQSWNDTVTSLLWTFKNGTATIDTHSTTVFNMNFAQPGWVDLTMKATGNHTGDTTVEFKNAVFVADATGTSATNYMQEWQPSGDHTKWPYFNYYNNEFKWQMDSTVGFNDHYCMKYNGFDRRIDPNTFLYAFTGTPLGDFDDLFSVPMDLGAFSDTCNLNFYYSAASRSSSSLDINDSLLIDYTINNGTSWVRLAKLNKGSLINKGALATEYIPSSQSDWAPKTIGIPAAARTAYTTFRFRYKPNVTNTGGTDPYGNQYSSGNNFYMDRVNFSRTPAFVDMVKLDHADVVVVPNPTSGDAYVVIKDANNVTAKITITDLTGKVVYTTSQEMNGSEAHVLIPHAAIAVSGMYLVTTTTGTQTQTKKLVVY